MSHRKFTTAAEQIASDWLANPVQNLSVTSLGPFSNTADGACLASLPGGETVFVKPRPDAQKHIIVAREKIVSDLGSLLELPVAPVVVRRPDGAEWPHYSAASLVCLGAGRQWGSGGQTYFDAAAPALEALRVFWSWVGDGDHTGHGGNLIYEVATGGCHLAAIDHAYSLCYGNPNDPITLGACGGYGTHGLPQVEAARDDIIDKISALSGDVIGPYVSRLDEILTMEEQERITRILNVRRDNLRAIVGL